MLSFVFNIFTFCSFFSAFKKIEFFLLVSIFVFVNPVQWCPLVVHKLTSRTSVGVEDWSSSSRPFPLGPLWVCCCCCCCCRPSRRLLTNTRSICSWHSFRTSCNAKDNREVTSIFLNLQSRKCVFPASSSTQSSSLVRSGTFKARLYHETKEQTNSVTYNLNLEVKPLNFLSSM